MAKRQMESEEAKDLKKAFPLEKKGLPGGDTFELAGFRIVKSLDFGYSGTTPLADIIEKE